MLTPEPEPVLASDPIESSAGAEPEPMVLLSVVEAPEPIDVESELEAEDEVLARAGRANAAITSDVQINFFIKPPFFTKLLLESDPIQSVTLPAMELELLQRTKRLTRLPIPGNNASYSLTELHVVSKFTYHFSTHKFQEFFCMKFLVAISVLAVSSAFAATTNPQDCLKQKKNLDRRYCLDSYLETVKESYDAEAKGLANGIPAATKTAKVSSMEQEIQAKKDYMNLIKSEIELQEKHLEAVKNAKVAANAPVKKEKKKKKKDKGFKIKL